MISLNATFGVQLVLFLTLLFLMNRMMIQPIFKIMLERESHIEERKARLSDVQARIHKLTDDYKRRLRRAEREARSAQEQIKGSAMEEARMIGEDVDQKVVAIRKKVRADVEGELEKARKQLKEQADSLSYEVTERLVGRRI